MAKQGSNAKRRILKAKIDFLSLCPRGANTIKTVYKADDGRDKNVSFSVLTKDLTDQGELVAVVYSPNLVDCQGDYATAEVIKQMAYDFAASGQGIDIRHNNQPVAKENAFVAESFIIQKGDSRFADMKDYDGKAVQVEGGWGVVIKIDDEELRRLYKSGEWGGISMGGFMLTKNEEAESGLIQKMYNLFEKHFGTNKSNDTEIEMDKKELTDVLAANNTALVTALKEALTPKAKTEAELAAEKLAKEAGEKKLGMGYPVPVLKENPTETDIAEFSKKMEIYELSKSVDRTDIESVRKFQKMAKEIATGKEVAATTAKKEQDAYGSFFQTNQAVDGVVKSGEATLYQAMFAKEDAEKAKKTA